MNRLMRVRGVAGASLGNRPPSSLRCENAAASEAVELGLKPREGGAAEAWRDVSSSVSASLQTAGDSGGRDRADHESLRYRGGTARAGVGGGEGVDTGDTGPVVTDVAESAGEDGVPGVPAEGLDETDSGSEFD